MDEQPGRRGVSPRVIAATVVAVFVAPILLAWWMAVARPPGEHGLVNRGTLIRPPIDIKASAALAPLGDIELGPGEWAMLYYAPTCGADCRAVQTMLTTIHSVLGHDSTRVRLVSLLDEAVDAPGLQVLANPAARRYLAAAVSTASDNNGHEQGVVFLDWRGQIMIYYSNVDVPADIKKDLKRLLRGSKIN